MIWSASRQLCSETMLRKDQKLKNNKMGFKNKTQLLSQMLRKLSRQQKMKSTELLRLLTCTTVNSMKTSSRTTDLFSPTPMNHLSESPSKEGNRVVSQNHGSLSSLLIKLMSQVKYPTKRLSATLKDALKFTIQRRGKLSWPRRRIKWPRFSTWYARFTKRYSSLTLSTKQ